MPKLTIEDVGDFDVDHGVRLVIAIKDNKGDINHACGGNARCTTCRVEFANGEPDDYSQAEHEKLSQTNSMGKYRLSCQCIVDRDMTIRVLDKFSESDRPDPGSRPEDNITPDPQWITLSK